MAIALVSNVSNAGGVNGGTSSSIDTSGATLLVAVVVRYNGATTTVSDSKGNTWTALTALDRNSPGDPRLQIYYVANPVVGTGHTFTLSGTGIYAAEMVAAFSGTNTSSPLDQQNTNGFTSGNTITTGSITPSVDNCLLVYGAAVYFNPDITSVNVGTLLMHAAGTTGQNYGRGFGYQIQTTATARNPQFGSNGTSNPMAGAIASFKPAASGSATLTAAKGTFAETGNAAALKAALKLTAAQGAFSETGNAATLKAALKVTAAAGSFSETGNAALLKATFKLTAAAGSVNETGNAATLKAAFKLTCAAGSFAETGNAASLRVGNTLIAAKGTFSETGQAATLKGAFKLSAAKGTFSLTGNDASLVVPNSFVLQANAGTFSQTGQAASLKAARKTVASAGAISLTANAATLKALRRLTGANASFALSSQAASLVYSGELFAGPGIAVDLPYRPSAVDLPVRLTAVDLVSR